VPPLHKLPPPSLPYTLQSQDPIPVSVWTSTLKRTIESAAHLPFPKLRWKVGKGDAASPDGRLRACARPEVRLRSDRAAAAAPSLLVPMQGGVRQLPAVQQAGVGALGWNVLRASSTSIPCSLGPPAPLHPHLPRAKYGTPSYEN